MATTLTDLVDEVLSHLHSYTSDVEQTSTLGTDLAATGAGFLVHDGTLPASAGFVECGDELLYVSSVDQQGLTATIPAWGRGQQGSTSAAHLAGSKLTFQPKFPRSRVIATINQVIGALNPALYAVRSDESNTASPAVQTYPLPADVDEVIDVRNKSVGPSKTWVLVGRYRLDTKADTSVFPTGRSLDILQPLVPGQTVKVVYRGQLSSIASGGLLTDSGLSESARDIVVLGAVGRLLMMLDPARLDTTSVQQSQRDGVVQAGTPGAIARQMLALQAARVDDERNRLNRLYPAGMSFSR